MTTKSSTKPKGPRGRAKAICSHFYEPVEGKSESFQCKQCQNTYVQSARAGYGNLMQHLSTCVPDYEQRFSEHLATLPQSLTVTGSVPSYTSALYGWLEFIIMTNQPFSAVEDPVVRAMSRFEPISVETIMKYFGLVTKRVEAAIQDELPDKFGLLFDGWSERSTQYLAMVAAYPVVLEGKTCRRERLLSLAPFEDGASFTADAHAAHLDFILGEYYSKSTNDVLFLCGDNCATNVALAKSLKTSLIGCASHRFKLVMGCVLETFEPVLAKVNRLMHELKTLKHSGRLIKVMTTAHKRPLVAVTRNATHLSSTFAMVKRYLELKPYISEIPEMQPYVLTPSEEDELNDALRALADFDAITTYLQGSKITLAKVRTVFDKTLARFPAHFVQPNGHMDASADIVKYSDFENGVVKILTGAESSLTAAEATAMVPFKVHAVDETPATRVEMTIVEEILAEEARAKMTMYEDLSYLPATSNSVERLLRKCHYMLPDHREATTPEILERKLFLNLNKDLWSVATINDILFEEKNANNEATFKV